MSSSSILILLFSLAVFSVLCSSEQTLIRDVDLKNPVLNVIPPQVDVYTNSKQTPCERVRLVGQSRMKLKSYANTFHISIKASEEMPEKFHDKIEVCFHRNSSTGFCQCEKEWVNLYKGQWDVLMSPYEDRYVDVRFTKDMPGSVTISIGEETQHWRLVCLGIGFVLLLMAPIVSRWAPFYYSSSMVLGILLVVLILLFQSMKLLPTGRKNFFYLTIYGSLIGAGSFLVHYFSLFVNSILLNLGLSEDMHNPVSVFFLVGIVLAGAALGFWIVRKFVLSDDGTVDIAVAQFVKWAMRITAMVFIFQSTLDNLLAVAVEIMCWCICSLIISSRWRRSISFLQTSSVKGNMWQRRARQAAATHRQAEFLSRSGNTGLKRRVGQSPSSHYAWSNSPGLVISSPRRTVQQQDHYSTFHKTPIRKYSKKEWDEFTREATRDALSAWASTPEVCDWIAENAHRVHLEPEESSDSMDSSSNSSEETMEASGPSFFKWR